MENLKNMGKYLKVISKNGYIYPLKIQKQTRMPIKDVYEFLSKLEDLNYIEGLYRIHCKSCDKTDDKEFKVLNLLPEFYICKKCGTNNLSIENAILIYKIKEK